MTRNDSLPRGARVLAALPVLFVLTLEAPPCLAQRAEAGRSVGALFAPPTRPSAPQLQLERYARELAALERHPDARSARSALDAAQQALSMARQRFNDPHELGPSLADAWAALALASRRIGATRALRIAAHERRQADQAEAAFTAASGGKAARSRSIAEGAWPRDLVPGLDGCGFCGSTCAAATKAVPGPQCLKRPAARWASARAPDLVARAERAFAEGERVRDEPRKERAQRRARMLLEAAVEESRRIEADRAAQQAVQRWAAAVEARAEFERQASERAERTQREEAAQRARERVKQALADAHGQHEPQSTAALRERALLSLATAMALGLDAGRSRTLEQSVERASHLPRAPQRLAALRKALAEIDRTLAELGGPHPASAN